MKNMRIIIISFFFVCFGVFAQGQNSGILPTPAVHWQCTEGDTVFNFNPATTMPVQFDSIPSAESYTLIVVYKPLVDTEATVWSLSLADSTTRSLTTERILLGDSFIRYADNTDSKPAIHTLHQSVPKSDTSYMQLTLGDGNLMVAEMLYFDRRLGNAALRRVQTALAICYGITLGPVDYIASNGGWIWEYDCDDICYHHRVTGVGSDTVYGICQLKSHSEMEGGLVTVEAASLAPGTFLLFGDNNAPLTFESCSNNYNDDYETLSRSWRARLTGAWNTPFSLTFDIRDLPLPTDSLVLLVDGDIYHPSFVSSNAVAFSNVFFPSDTSYFTLGRGAAFWQSVSQTYGNQFFFTVGNLARNNINGHSSMSLYPNPTTERFSLEVSGAKWVRATIYNMQGKVMLTYSDSDKEYYLFEGALPSGNSYYATVTTEDGSQTIKIVVK